MFKNEIIHGIDRDGAKRIVEDSLKKMGLRFADRDVIVEPIYGVTNREIGFQETDNTIAQDLSGVVGAQVLIGDWNGWCSGGNDGMTINSYWNFDDIRAGKMPMVMLNYPAAPISLRSGTAGTQQYELYFSGWIGYLKK